jgi:hypothetical protein
VKRSLKDERLLKKKLRVLEIEYHWYLNGGRSGGP